MVYYPENVFGKQIFSSNNGNVFTNFALLCIKRDPPPEIPLPSIADAIWWDGAKKLDTTISQEAILKDTGVTRKCDNIQKNSNAK